MIKIALDVMAGDKGINANIDGALSSLDGSFMVSLVGDQNLIRDKINQSKNKFLQSINIVDAASVISMDAKIAEFRSDRSSSIYQGLSLVKNNNADAFISIGNSGAIFANSLKVLGRIQGISRPGFAVPIPSINGMRILLDGGANADSKAENYLHFALLGAQYYESVFKKRNPKIGLLSIGSEPSKGSQLTLEAYKILEENCPNFIGNIEGTDLTNDVDVDVVVSDGFTGNVALKSMEGIAELIKANLIQESQSNLMSKVGLLLLKPSIKKIYKRLDYRQYGAVPLLGVNGLVYVGHGRSDFNAVENAIHAAVQSVHDNLFSSLEQSIDGTRNN
jgi:glycerol-3-phosphate acyltransferase PlsX